MAKNKLDSIKGSMFGLATGDALGATLEFKLPGMFKPIKDIVGGGIFKLKAGQWTDDTSMALCLAESLITKKGKMNLQHQLQTYYRWFSGGHLSSTDRCFDIGGATIRSLLAWKRTGKISTSAVDAGNGSIMRLAPVPIVYHNNIPNAIIQSATSSLSTHGSQEAMDGCKLMGGIIAGLINGYSKEEVLLDMYWQYDKFKLSRRIESIARGNYKKLKPPVISNGGWVVATLESALWAFYNTRDFKEGALKVVNLGRDADTVGAVYGQIAGAYYGFEGIPKKWREIVAHKHLIQWMALNLHKLSRTN